MNEQETIDDIIAEIRKISAEKYRLSGENGGASGNPGVYYLDFAQFARVISDRLEAAWKRKLSDFNTKCDWSVQEALDFANTLANHGWTRETNSDAASSCIYSLCRLLKERGDCAKLRKVLIKAQTALVICEWPDGTRMEGVAELMHQIDAALAAPPRNCDVGTANDQAERYSRYCDKFTLGGMHCETCPCCGKIQFGKCEFAWAQMPYKEGGAK